VLHHLAGFLTLQLRTYLLYLPPLREWLKKAFVAVYSSGAVADFHRLPLQIHFFYNKNSGDCQVFFNFILKIIYYKVLALFSTLASLKVCTPVSFVGILRETPQTDFNYSIYMSKNHVIRDGISGSILPICLNCWR